MGKILDKMDVTGERIPKKGGRPKKTVPGRVRLEDMGLTRKDAKRAQDLASVPDDEFDAYLDDKRDKNEIVSKGVTTRHFARKTTKARKRKQVQADAGVIDGTFRVLYADPPWNYGSSGVITTNDSYGRANRHFESLTIKQLCDLQDTNKTRIVNVLRPDAVLFLWVTTPMLAECWPVIEAWGFTYKSEFIWDKVRHNYGSYLSIRHEHLLICAAE